MHDCINLSKTLLGTLLVELISSLISKIICMSSIASSFIVKVTKINIQLMFRKKQVKTFRAKPICFQQFDENPNDPLFLKDIDYLFDFLFCRLILCYLFDYLIHLCLIGKIKVY